MVRKNPSIHRTVQLIQWLWCWANTVTVCVCVCVCVCVNQCICMALFDFYTCSHTHPIIFIVINVLAVGGCCIRSSRTALHGSVNSHFRGRLQKVDTRTGGAGEEAEGHCRWVPWDLHHLNRFLPSVHQYLRGRDSSVGRESNWKARRNTDVGLSPRCGKGFDPSPC